MADDGFEEGRRRGKCSVGGSGEGGEVGGDGCRLVEIVKMVMLMEKGLVKKERGGEEGGLPELGGTWGEGRRRLWCASAGWKEEEDN